MGTGVAPRQPRQGLVDLLQEGLGQPARRHGAQGVAVQAGVLRSDEALLASDAHARGAALAHQFLQHPIGRHAGQAPRRGLVGGQVADAAQHVVQRVGVGGLGALAQALKVGLDLVQRCRVDQLAQLLLAE